MCLVKTKQLKKRQDTGHLLTETSDENLPALGEHLIFM